MHERGERTALSTRFLAVQALEFEGAVKRMADGLRGRGPAAEADPADLRVAIAIMAGMVREWLTQATEVAALEHRFAEQWQTLNSGATAAICELNQPVPLHARDANHALYVAHQLAVAVSNQTDEHVGLVRHASQYVDGVLSEFGIVLPRG